MDAHSRTAVDPPGASAAPAPAEQIPGGRYHLVERLSAGAIGAVYKALDTILDRPVAVKSIRLDTPFAEHGPDELRERFVREARIAARLQHPNIVTIHDIVATDNRGYIIMEFIEGQSLESLLKSTGRLPLSTAIRVVSQLASALDYAHARNVVHRDVKPSNIIVSEAANIWVTDFGIAKSELSTNLTVAGGVVGTPDYMSPEQAKGDDVDARSDLFAVGCVLFECVTGLRPFRSKSLTGVLLSIINDEPGFPPDWEALGLPAELKPILRSALEKDREKRYATGSALVEALACLPARDVEGADEARERRSEESAESEPPEPARSETREEGPKEEPEEEGTEAGAVEEEVPDASAPEAPVLEDGGPNLEDYIAEDLIAETAEEDEDTETPASGPELDEGVAQSGDELDVEVEVPMELGEEAEPDPEPAEAPSPDTVQLDGPEDAASEVEEPAPPPGEPSEEDIESLRTDGRPLRLSSTLSRDLQGVEISPEEGFVLSRVDGVSRASEILALSPMGDAESARVLLLLLHKKLIEFCGAELSGRGRASAPVEGPPPSEGGGSVDGETTGEIDRLLGLADQSAWSELLGIAENASERERKSAYRKIVAKYHPDKFSRVSENGFQEKLSRLCAAASEAVDALASRSSRSASETKRRDDPAAAREEPAGFDRRRHARELHDRALRAYEMQDFWDVIQLSRQAIEIDEAPAEFHFLLGRALMHNKRWRKEAADAFRKASEIEPMNIDYLGMLGAIYKVEGLTTRAESVLKKAREIDPEYQFPEIEGEAEVSPA